MRRVVLLYPCSRRYSGFLSTHRFPGLVTTHCGLTILAQILRAKGVETRVYDEQITPASRAMFAGADLVGISVQTSWAPQAYRIAERVRRLGIPVVLGGVHATLNPKEAIEHADYVVRGEGERTLSELVDAIDQKRPLEGILGLSFHKDGERVHNPPRPLLSNDELDAVPFPRVGLIEGISDRRRFPVNAMMYFTMATRGCDQFCTYCSITRVFGRGLRHRSPGNVVEELRAHFDPERQFLFFMDDSIAVDRDYIKELLTRMLDEGLRPRLGWHSQMRADVATDPELLSLLRASNCTFVTCGFESVEERSLKSLGKGQSPRDVERAVAKLREHEIVVNGFFMFGTDHDTIQTFGETVRFAKRSGCMIAGFMPLTPFPGTATFEQLDRDDRIFTRDWELYDVQHVVFRPRNMTAWELYWRCLACYPAFYASGRLVKDAGLVLTRDIKPKMVLIGASWPIMKQLYLSREVVGNLDYVRAVRRLDEPGASFPDLSNEGLFWKDLWTSRSLRPRVAPGA